MRARPGFTLVELIVALVLSTFVLIAIVGVTSQMLRYSFESSRKSASTGWTAMTLDQMRQEVQTATVLVSPGQPDNTATAVLSGCSNWTTVPGYGNVTGGTGCTNAVTKTNCPLDPTMTVTSFYYCVWPAASTPTNTPWLLHYSATGSCPFPTPTCGTTGGYSVVAQDFYPDAGQTVNYFFRDNSSNGVRLLFMVGIGTMTLTGNPNNQVPTAQHIDMKIPLRKAYANNYD